MAVKNRLRQLLRLFAISAKMDLMWFLRDTKIALIVIASEVISSVSVVASVYMIALRFGGIGAMTTDEVLFMLAYSTLTTGIFILFDANNNIFISRVIGRGQLEHLFIQPLPLKTQLLTSGFIPFTGNGTFIVGCILLGIAINRLSIHITVWWLLSLLAYTLATMTIIVARAYLISSTAFYAPVAAEEISSTVINGTWLLSTFPLGGMPAFIQIPLLTVMPEGLMAWFPALSLLGRPPLGLPGYYPIAFALLLTIIAGAVFRKGMKYYVTRGSNRYVPYGFRR